MSSPPAPRAFSGSIFRRLASERLFLAILGIALVLPLALSRSKEIVFLGLPLITSGDEPHYLVTINSLLDDGDLDLRNNYASARQGSLELGRGRSGAPLDHHVQWYAPDGTAYGWSQIFEYPPGQATTPGQAASLPRIKPNAPYDFRQRPEYSQHPIGLALLLAPALYWVRGTPWVEHLAVVLSALATFAMALAVRELFRLVSAQPGVVNAATLVTVLGSPLWHYGRMLYSEPWLALWAVLALSLALRRRAFFLAGCCIAIGIQMKPPFALLALPLLIDCALRRDWRRAVLFSLPLIASTAAVLFENKIFFGSPLRSAQPWVNGNPLEGALGLALSWNHGLIPFAPAVLLSFLGFRGLFASHRRYAWLFTTTFAAYYLLMSLWPQWRGGYCYGPRLILPVIPLAFLGIAKVFESLPDRSPRFQRTVLATCGLSLGIGAAGALLHLAFWNSHPLIAPFILLAKHT